MKSIFDASVKVRLLKGATKDPTKGCLNYRGKIYKDSPQMKVQGKYYRVNRLAYLLLVGDIPEGMLVCHSCDNPGCINRKHLWLGTHQDNMDDMVRKGRQAKAERHGLRLHPERAARGDDNGSRKYPERLRPNFGDNNGARKHIERMSRGVEHSEIMKRVAARGASHGSKTHPEKVSRGTKHSNILKKVAARGDANGSRKHPEKLPRGSEHWTHKNSKLNEWDIRFIRYWHEKGYTNTELAGVFLVNRRCINGVVTGSSWAHVI